jgi:hypothetical protein
MTYEPPTIEERAEVDGPVIGFVIGSAAPVSPAWRRIENSKDDADD